MPTCSKCGKQINNSEEIFHGTENKIYCKDCAEQLTKCAHNTCHLYLEDNEVYLSKHGFLCKKHWDIKYFICHECGTILPRTMGHQISSSNCTVCDDCFHEKYFKCDDCDTVHPITDQKCLEVFEEKDSEIKKTIKHLCPDCSNNYVTCESCNKTIHRRNKINIHSLDVNTKEMIDFHGCIACASEKFERCCECGDYFSIFPKVYTTSSGNKICEKCYFQHSYVIKNYSFKPRNPKFHTLNSKNDLKLFFGVENEIELTRPKNIQRDGQIDFTTPIFQNKVKINYNTLIAAGVEQIIPDFIYQKHDGSLDYGIELVSQPADLEYWLSITDKITELFTYLKEKNCIGDNARTAGMHIHINKERINQTHQKVFSAFIYKNKLNVEKIAGRKENHYNHYLDISQNSSNDLLKNNFLYTNSKYSAVNWLPPKTVELRCFQSTLVPQIFLSNIEFAEAAVLFTANHSMADILTENCWDEFCKFIESQKTRYECLVNHMNTKEVWVAA